jgi:hypothetical protein
MSLMQVAERHDYVALSYEWGKSTASHDLELNGRTTKIRENLYWFLRCYQLFLQESSLEAEYLWIDAICINQDDRKEKGFQVAMMGSIYKHASLVRVWLGRAAADSEAALEFVSFCLEHRSTELVERSRELFGEDGGVRCEVALLELLQRSYWKRAWIVQELILGTEVRLHCGTKAITLRNIYDWQKFSDNFWPNNDEARRKAFYRKMERSRAQRLLEERKALRKNWDPDLVRPLSGIVARHSKKLCFDARDKLYAFLALADLGSKKGAFEGLHLIHPDYDKSYEEVFFDTLFFDLTRGFLHLGRFMETCLFDLIRAFKLDWPDRHLDFENPTPPWKKIFASGYYLELLTADLYPITSCWIQNFKDTRSAERSEQTWWAICVDEAIVAAVKGKPTEESFFGLLAAEPETGDVFCPFADMVTCSIACVLRPTPDTEMGWTAIGWCYYTLESRNADMTTESKIYAKVAPPPPTSRFKLQDCPIAWQIDTNAISGHGPDLSFQLGPKEVTKFLFDVLDLARWQRQVFTDCCQSLRTSETAEANDDSNPGSNSQPFADTVEADKDSDTEPFVNRMYFNPKRHRAGRAVGAEINPSNSPQAGEGSNRARLRAVLNDICFDATVRSSLTIRTDNGTYVVAPKSRNTSVTPTLY